MPVELSNPINEILPHPLSPILPTMKLYLIHAQRTMSSHEDTTATLPQTKVKESWKAISPQPYSLTNDLLPVFACRQGSRDWTGTGDKIMTTRSGWLFIKIINALGLSKGTHI